MSGTSLLLRIQARAQWRRVAVWVLAMVASMAFTALAVAGLYDTPAKVATYGEAVVSDALVAINGRVEGIDTLGGIVQDEFGFMGSFLLPLMGLALVASMTRGEEESGRLESLLAGRIGRTAPVLVSLVVASAAIAAMVVGFVGSLLASGIDLGDAVLYSLASGMVSLVFAAVAATAAQVVLHGRGVYLVGFAVVGLSYVLRGVGDVRDSFWVWLSPLGWLEKTAPFADQQRWWVLLIPAAVSLALAAAALALAARRDLGAAIYRPGPGPASASPRLRGPLGLAAHGQRGAFLGWLLGSVLLAAVMGALAQEMVDAALGNPDLSRALGISEGEVIDGFLAVVQLYLAILGAGYLVQSIGTMRHEEVGGRLEPMLAGGLSRSRWLAAQVAVVIVGLVVVVVGSAVAFGLATVLSTGETGYLGTLVGAGLAYLPAELVIGAVGALLFGLLPRAYGLAWVLFGLVAAIGLLGPGLQLDQWIQDLSPLTHVGNPPSGTVEAASLVWLLAIAAALVAGAFVTFRQRRIPQG
ncbi:hypothetical protein E8D34_07910 [Nocardioides sp. GY 10113]|uniref:ABC transporter permease n=1 Tax=Nocardioides sp. GY 10113 TaxID=2569761 RepID=UPI0010A7D7DB|nr:hypothetical protein [Nocardioides sp. GY 10113]TIC87606.1 hypothetical protein E8D34_07910 [Nocardioides sp. GY 10113]